MNVSERIWGVSELTREIKQTLESAFPPLWLKGELSGVLLHRSGHLYLTLKDAGSQIKGVMWRQRVRGLDFRPEDGLEVLLFGRVVVYERGGQYQFDIEVMQPAGRGALWAEFEKLRVRLEAEGLFAAGRKRPIPRYPRRIGVVTSASGAAVRDVLVTLARRGFALEVLFVPVRVQGEGAAGEIAGALDRLARHDPPPDVILLARGGGSLEDLWAFNEETVVRAVAECSVPVITGVGHETDTTLADYAADLRAPTPTGAAERATPDRSELAGGLAQTARRLARAVETRIGQYRHRLETAAGAYGLRRVPDRLRQGMQQLDDLQLRGERALRVGLDRRRERVRAMADRLTALDPRQVLARGYAVVRREGEVIRDADRLAIGERVELLLARGGAESEITRIIPPGEGEGRGNDEP